MPQSLFKPIRYRIFFFVCWWAAAQFIAVTEARSGLSWKWSVTDGVISSSLLAGAVLLTSLSLKHYLPQRNRYSYLLSMCCMFTIVWLALSFGLLAALPGSRNALTYFSGPGLWIRGAFGFLIIGCMALVSMLWYTLQDQQETDRRKAETERLSRDAELTTLRQQLQPHFLFNALNSINTLITLQPEQARQMVLQLSEFLRGTLTQDQRQWITIEEELEHLQRYLTIEKVRFGHRLQTSVRMEAPGMKLPVLLLQPVVENAIKFGLYDTTGDITISIHAFLSDGMLQIEVSNPFDPETSAPRKGTGFGLASVERRLYLLFARNDLLSTRSTDAIFTTRIKVPQP